MAEVMTLEKLKELCLESLNLYYDIQIEGMKIDTKRAVLFNFANKRLNLKQEQLKRLEKKFEEYIFIFETDIKTLCKVINSEIENMRNVKLKIVNKGKQHRTIKSENGYEVVEKNFYELQLCRGYLVLTILEFSSQQDDVACEDIKINLLEEGFIRSSKFKIITEEIEKNVPGFQNLVWGIVSENIKTKVPQEISSKQEKITFLQHLLSNSGEEEKCAIFEEIKIATKELSLLESFKTESNCKTLD